MGQSLYAMHVQRKYLHPLSRQT